MNLNKSLNRIAPLSRPWMSAALLATAATLGTQALASSAIQTLPRVTVEGRAALESSCPSALAELQDGIGNAVRLHGEEGVMRVSFTLEGQNISNVQTLSGPRPYKPVVKKAIKRLNCQAPSTQAQTHVFELTFTAES